MPDAVGVVTGPIVSAQFVSKDPDIVMRRHWSIVPARVVDAGSANDGHHTRGASRLTQASDYTS